MKPIFSRREFVGASAITAAACAASSVVPALSAPPESTKSLAPIPLGVASYTFRNFSRAQLIEFMKQLNVSALNAKDVKDHIPMDPSEESKALSDYAAANIKLHATGVITFAKDDDEDIRSKFEYVKRAGVPIIVAGGGSPEILRRIEKFVREFDIKIAIHNHGPEDKQWPSPLEILKTVTNMDSRIGCCIDVGHTVRAGVDVASAIHQAGPRLFNVHMKDLTDFHSEPSQVAVGDGNMPVRAIFEALRATRYPGFVDLEYEIHPDDPMPGVISSLAYMRGVLAGIA
jgi:sugar phosphate isomerase/epimerase